jgi:serine/threonine protein kinase
MFKENIIKKTNPQEKAPEPDFEVQQYLIEQQIKKLIEKKKAGNMTTVELLEARKSLDAQLDHQKLSQFKQQELIDAFDFEGNAEVRSGILEYIQGKESISATGSNQCGVYELPGNKIVKVVSEGNYAYELPLVKLTSEVQEGNVVRTYDVFKHEGGVYVVQDKAPGKEVHKYSQEELGSIPQEHYDALVQLVNTYAAHGIGTDPSKISNLFYDPEKGFSIIDLGAATYQRGLDYHINNYFTNNLSKEKVESAVERFGTHELKPILPTLQDKLKALNIV